jgi:CMP-N,N'-diacetyllegionaminic acid synthase
MSKTVAIIPARSGSKGLINKNIAPLGGFPLIAYSIVAAKLTSDIERVIVSTDSEQYAEIALSFGAEVPFIRPISISTDSSTDFEFMIHAIDWLEENDGDTPEYWVHLRPTTPFRDPKIIQTAIEFLLNRDSATALRSAHKCSESPFKWFRHNEEGFLMALTSENTDLDHFNSPRQIFPEVFIPDGYVDIVRRSFLKTSGLLHGNKVLAFASPVCTEIDSVEELKRLEFELTRDNQPVFEHLREMRK